MRPAREEIRAATDWVKEQDGNPGWPKHVDEVLVNLAKALGYELESNHYSAELFIQSRTDQRHGRYRNAIR